MCVCVYVCIYRRFSHLNFNDTQGHLNGRHHPLLCIIISSHHAHVILLLPGQPPNGWSLPHSATVMHS